MNINMATLQMNEVHSPSLKVHLVNSSETWPAMNWN